MKTAIIPVSYGPLGTGTQLFIRGVAPVDDTGRPKYFYAISSETSQITSGNVEMLKNQWDNWGKTPTDEEYQLSCIAANLGLTCA